MPEVGESTTASAVLLSAVAIKLPQFWPDKAVIWFKQAESQFFNKNVTQESTKYHHVVASLPSEVCSRVLDILEDPSDAPYTALKSRLLEKYTLDDYQRAEALCNLPIMSDQSPSQLMDQMLSIFPSGHAQSCLLFRYQFLRRLSPVIRMTLSTMKFENPRDLAATADILWRAQATNATVAALPPIHMPDCDLMAALGRRPVPAPRRNRPSPAESNQICWYHNKWGDSANRCVSPCSYIPGNSRAGGRTN